MTSCGLEGSPVSRMLLLLSWPASSQADPRAEGLQVSPAVHRLLLARIAALLHGKDFPAMQVNVWMSVPEQMACACLIWFRNQLKATRLVTCIRRVERMKNEVYGV